MIVTTELRTLLLPELESEIEKTRKTLAAVPDGHTAYKPAEKSGTLAWLAGHVADMPGFVTLILTAPDFDFGVEKYAPFVMETSAQAVAEFNEKADATISAMKNISDQVLMQNWKLTYHGAPIFEGTRYAAYREMGLDHLIHHRAQLGVYLRLLGAAVPGCYGPSADEPWNG